MNRSFAPALLSLAILVSPAAAVYVHGPASPRGIPSHGASGLVLPRTGTDVAATFTNARLAFEASIQRVLDVPAGGRTFENTVKALETADAEFSEATGPLYLMSWLSPDDDVRKAAEAATKRVGPYMVSTWARPEIFAAYKAYADKGETLTGEDKRLFDAMGRGFKSSGHGLSAEDKAKLTQTQQRLSQLASEFNENIKNANAAFEATREQLKGLPDAFIDSLEKTADGKYRVTTKEPHYVPFMKYAEDADARRTMEKIALNKASDVNKPILVEILRLRDQSAKILGYESYPHAALDGRMAAHPDNVWDFLNDLMDKLQAVGRREIGELLAMKRKDVPDAKRLESSDRMYYGEKLRRAKYDIDMENVAEYFPVDTVVNGTMRVYERVLGVKFTEVLPANAWHPEVRLFKIADGATGADIGYIYLDLFPRENKYDHQAAANFISGRRLADGSYRLPMAAMMSNFTKGAPGQPSLLRIREVETYFHEFGHLMHQTLTKAKYASMSGSAVATDFVEAPSQMLENFVWEREVLDLISGHHADPSKKLPEDLYQKLLASRHYHEFGGAMHYLGQLALALADMTLHTAVPAETTRLFNQLLEMVTGVKPQKGLMREPSFGHLVGYGAGYYSYLWSEVFADDIYTRFKKEGVFNPAVGMAWRREVLEKGSSRPEMESLKAFLGREPSSEAFLAKLLPPTVTPEALRAHGDKHLAELSRALKVRGVSGITVLHDGDFYWKVTLDGSVPEDEVLKWVSSHLPGRVKVETRKPIPVG